MPISVDGDGTNDNEGPHCRNCHVGANNCDVCHADDSTNFSAAYTSIVTTKTAGKTPYAAQSFIKQSAVVGLNGKCLDGGFSFPHRTLGANLLKDELYGIDFDGTVIGTNVVRTANGGAEVSQNTTFSVNGGTAGFAYWVGEKQNAGSLSAAVRNDNGALVGQATENLDTVCIDCHGDATYWNGDNAAAFKTAETSTGVLGVYGSGQSGGWDLLLKGLP